MSTQPVYVFFHDATVTLVRAHALNGCEVFRNGELVASIPAHPNHQVSFTPSGRVLLPDGHGRPTFAEVGGEWPQAPQGAPAKLKVLFPDDEHALVAVYGGYPYEDPVSGERHVGHLYKVVAGTGAVVETWTLDALVPRQVHPFGEERTHAVESWRQESWKVPTEGIKHDSHEVVLAPDGEHWAIVQAKRIALGRGPEQTADVYWHEFSFYPENAVFDLPSERVFVAGSRGIVAFGLGGEPVAHWWGTREVHGPVLVRGDEVLAIVEVTREGRYGLPKWLTVERFDRHTLASLGPLEAMPRRRLDTPASSLLETPDGAILWVPRFEPILVLPAADPSRWSSTEHVRVVGDEPPPRFPVLDDPEYDAEIGAYGSLELVDDATGGQRRSLAHFLLEELTPDPRFPELLQADLDAFAPLRETVLGFDDAAIERLRQLDHQFYWLSRDAPDDAVDALVDRIRTQRTPVAEARALLLFGVLTPRSLAHVGDLGRAHGWVRTLAWDHHLEIPEAGPALPRFVPEFVDLVSEARAESDPSLQLGRTVEAFGSLCRKPFVHVLSISVDGIDSLLGSPLREQHWYLGNCQSCDAWLEEEQLVFDTSGPRSATPRDDACPGEPNEPNEDGEPESVLVRTPYRSEAWNVKGRLGGRASWWQSPAVPGCPDCGRQMFYVGFVKADAVRDDMFDAGLWGFHCEDCGVGVEVWQIT